MARIPPVVRLRKGVFIGRAGGGECVRGRGLVWNWSAVRAGAGPFDFAIGVAFLFPDGDLCFDGVDEKAVGLEGGLTVRGAGQSDDGAVSDF